MDAVDKAMVVYYIHIPLIYNIVDMVVYFGFAGFNWPASLSIRIIFILADFGWAVGYAVRFNQYYRSYERNVLSTRNLMLTSVSCLS